MSGIPNNLPQQLTSFIGRKRELEELAEAIGTNRLVTLIGAGGLGKTRLSLELARGLADQFPGGVWFADLSETQGSEDPALSIAYALHCAGESQSDPLHALTAFLRSGASFLILDNCEHIVDSCARLAETLLDACPGLRILATSRQILNIAAEVIYRLQPLSCPEEAPSYNPGALDNCEAIALFLDRARSRRGDFELTPRNSRAVVKLCRALDGMPLALELAAACLNVLSVEQIVARLDDRFRLLSWGSRTASVRQQSLRALIDWSYNALSVEEQRLLLLVSVFSGGFTLEACGAVLDAPEHEYIGHLAALVDKSLVTHEEREGVSRYRLLETVKHYAREKFLSTGGEAEARDRHLAYFEGVTEEAAGEFNSIHQADWVHRLGIEYDNLYAALVWASTSPRRARKGLRIAWDLKWFWVMYGRLAEARTAISRVIDLLEPGYVSGDMSRAVNTEALLAWYMGDDESAQPGYERALKLARASGDVESASFALKGLGNLARRQGNYAAARAFCEEALQLDEQSGDQAVVALSLLSLGRVSGKRGTYREATRWLERSLSTFDKLGDNFGVASARYELALVAVEREAFGKAVDLAVQSMEVFQGLGVKFRAAQCLFLLAEIASRTHQAERAAVLYGAAETFLADIGATLLAQEAAEHEQHEATARTQISNSAWEAAWNKGAAMTLDDALAFIRAMRSRMEDGEDAAEDQPLHAALTTRELEVLRLVAARLSGPTVAEKLSISPRTVEAHVRSIYSKLEITGRKELMRYAQENGLI